MWATAWERSIMLGKAESLDFCSALFCFIENGVENRKEQKDD